jgi:hypothetical protein
MGSLLAQRGQLSFLHSVNLGKKLREKNSSFSFTAKLPHVTLTLTFQLRILSIFIDRERAVNTLSPGI